MFNWRSLILVAVALCQLTACAPRIQAYESPIAEPKLYAGQLTSSKGTSLPVRSWVPHNPEELKAVIIGVHGFNDYSNAFFSPGLYFSSNGIAMYAYDQRGFGATNERGIWAGKRNLVLDLAQMVRAVRKKHPELPLYILGESMGGAVVITALGDPDFPKVDGAILSAPAIWGNHTMPFIYRGALWMAAHTMPWKRVSGRSLKILASDNIAMLRAMGKDPLIIKETRIDAVYGIVDLMDDAYDHVEAVKTPLLLLYGMNDQVIPERPIFEVVDRLKAPYKLAYYPQGYHMLLRDLKAQIVMDDIAAWVSDRNAFLPSGHDLNWRALVGREERLE